MKLKYIRGSHLNDFVIFPQTINHNDMARLTRSAIGEPKSAGFLHFQSDEADTEVKAVCYGRSVSLDLDSAPEDSEIINHALNGY